MPRARFVNDAYLAAPLARARDTVTSARVMVTSPPRHAGTKRC